MIFALIVCVVVFLLGFVMGQIQFRYYCGYGDSPLSEIERDAKVRKRQALLDKADKLR